MTKSTSSRAWASPARVAEQGWPMGWRACGRLNTFCTYGRVESGEVNGGEREGC